MNKIGCLGSSFKSILVATLGVAGLATLCAGCAANPTQDETKVTYRAPIYRTGSLIPVGRESPGDASSSPDNTPNDWQNMMPHTYGRCPGGSTCN